MREGNDGPPPDTRALRLVVDGVFFQLNTTGIARVWTVVLRALAHRAGIDLVVLDRGRLPDIPGARRLAFPPYDGPRAAADSVALQALCDDLGADLFSSTYYTTPLTTPMVLMVYDMIPEMFGFDLTSPMWREKAVALAYAQRLLCISDQTRADLLALTPALAPDRVSVAHCGVDGDVFVPPAPAAVAAFRARHGLVRPYVMFVGSRVQTKGYKNSDLFFRALAGMAAPPPFDLLCIGGEPAIDPAHLAALPRGMVALRMDLSDADLVLAYGGAWALVYPSLYEGFGLPVIEAMATGCPVITTHRGSLAVVAGTAALIIDGTSDAEMVQALDRLADADLRADLRRRGLAHAAGFRWGPMVDGLVTQGRAAIADAATDADRARAAAWADQRRAVAAARSGGSSSI